MPIIAPLIGLAGSTAVRRIVAGGVVYVIGKETVGYVSDEAGEAWQDIEDELKAAGVDIVDSGVERGGDLNLDFIRGLIPALIEGAQAGYDAIREGFRGKEPETIAALTISVLVIVTILTLRHEVGTGPRGAGEYAAGNRPP